MRGIFIKKKYVIALLMLCLLIIAMLLLIDNTYFAILMISYVSIMSFLALNYNKNIFILCFLSCFFIFLMGRPVAYEIFNFSKPLVYKLDAETINYVYLCLTISLFGIVFGYKLSGCKEKKGNTKIVPEEYSTALSKVTRFMSIILYVIVCIENVLRLVYIKQVGYTASYAMNFDYKLSYGLHYLVEVAPVAFALYLATLPKKKNAMLPIILFVLSNLIMAASGNRFEIISGFMLLLIYFCLRNRLSEDAWITRKQILIVFISVPVVILLLQYMIYWREGNQVDSTTNPFFNFLHGVGGSSDLIGITYEHGNNYLDSDVLYSFGNVWRNINGNVISKIFGNNVSFQSQTIEKALYGHSLSATLTYAFYPSRFLKGYGLGGCYIAELLHDFSLIGVAIGNFIIGIIIGSLKSLRKDHIFRNFLCIFLVTLLLRLPRDSFDYFVIEFIGIKNILFFLMILLLTNLYVKKIKREA